MDTEKKLRTFTDWVISTRPWSFPASVIPILATGTYLYHAASAAGLPFDMANALLAMLMMLMFQAGGNLSSDYYDHIKGVDLPGSLNGVRHIQSGKFTPKEIRNFGLILFTVAAATGIIILCRSSFSYTWIGVAGLLLALFYPFLKYRALGDVDILLCYALLPAAGLSYAVTGALLPEVLPLSLPFGLMTVSILHANNTRDIRNDRMAGIRTMPGFAGGRLSQWIYAAEVTIPYVLIIAFMIAGMIGLTALITFLSIPLAYKNISTMMKAAPESEEDIAELDKTTAQMQLLFGILYSLSFIAETVLNRL